MNKQTLFLASLLLLGAVLIWVYPAGHLLAKTITGTRIKWGMEVLLLDNINKQEKYTMPMKEAVEFIRNNSRFDIKTTDVSSNLPHTYTHYDCPEGVQTCVLVNKWDVAQSIIDSLHITSMIHT